MAFKDKYKQSIVKKKPWIKSYWSAKRRCLEDKEHYYHKKRVNFNMTQWDFKDIWERDNAHKMKEPTIDRINPLIGYIKSNCRFLERLDNQRRIRKVENYNNVKNLLFQGYKIFEISKILNIHRVTVGIYKRRIEKEDGLVYEIPSRKRSKETGMFLKEE